MIIEIIYDYHVDRKSPALESWTYFFVKCDDKEKAITKAKSYFKKFCTEHGWTGKAKIKEVDIITSCDKIPKFITIPEEEIPKKNATNPKRNRTSVRQSKRTPAVKEPKVRRLSNKSTKSDESSKSSGTDSGKNRRQTKPRQTRSRTARK